MRDLLRALDPHTEVALATVVATWHSAPRQAGASMTVDRDGVAAGSVSGGCVEGDVYERAREVLDGEPPHLVEYGISDDDAHAVGLTCGGRLSVFVERFVPSELPGWTEFIASVDQREPVAVATVVAGPTHVGTRLVIWPGQRTGTTGSDRLDDAITDDARGMLAAGRTGVLHVGADGERRADELTVFVESFAPAPRMLVFGAIDFAASVARIGAFLGYHVTVCDARPVFATAARFPDADDVVVEWPHQYLERTRIDADTMICVLTHDPKFDVPLLAEALRGPAGYIGVMGSRRTHADRVAKLLDAGVPEDALGRIRAPIGLDLGARTPEETAVSIAAEIIAARGAGTGRPLTSLTGPIHPPPPDLPLP